MFARMKKTVRVALGVCVASAGIWTASASADSIDPLSYEDTLAPGESVTIRKTVTVDEGAPSSGIVDVMFLIDTSGSMGAQINQAKAAAGDILNGLASFGDLATGFGYYSEPGSVGVKHDLTTDTATAISNLNGINLYDGGGGGDFPEEGIHATKEAALGASWRPGSSRFIIALGDATFKESDGSTLADAKDALDTSGATFIGIDYGGMTSLSGISVQELSDHSGGSIVSSSGLDTDDLVNDILAGVGDAFLNYSEVTVDDLGTSGPGVGVSVECVSADTGSCSGATATGSYDRSVARIFEFDVTFTGINSGVHDFTMDGLVDGASIARETDRITVTGEVSKVPEPGTLGLMGLGLLSMGAFRRRKQ
ncbi:PEP-CTERM sorting domain-containing protein [Marinobacter pelagius]|uniref:PEP-CTERM protein-sorting domain-containing protein n=1 Tax=Marinobacter pelagius TaxID=379482 RepID=A0A1I4T1H0_9GAMM|nr:vWA domain-containing protein [Marinobacter pelagius]SFM70485.1 PEP-CTERM protein-sorting domain-containing protein [Marinobacter pelagius]